MGHGLDHGKDRKNHKSILVPQIEIAVKFSTSRGVSGRRTRLIQQSSVGAVSSLRPLPAVPSVIEMALLGIESDFLIFHTTVPAVQCGLGYPIVVTLEGVALNLYIDGKRRDILP